VGEVFPYVVSQLYLDSFVFCKKFKIMSEDDNCIVAICEAEGLSAKGDRYDQIYAHFFNFKDGQISRLIEFGDSGLADRTIWQEVAPLIPDAEFSY
jgi:ketosteroid isomerase-like protein